MKEIYDSFRALPAWVQGWMLLILMPVNMGGLLFLDTSIGIWMAILGIGGMLPNLYIMLRDKGFSNAMALPHIAPWGALVIYLIWNLSQSRLEYGSPIFYFAWLMVLVNSVSLIFDTRDAFRYLQGENTIAGKE